MEGINVTDSIQEMLMKELIQGLDVTKKLQLMFFQEHRSSSNEEQVLIMVQKILGCYEKSIAIVQSDLFNQQSQRVALGTSDSPPSFVSGSPKSQDSEGDFKDPDQKDELKKRPVLLTERRLLPCCSNSGLEQPIEDGYNWRKYGQKDILATKYPRAYYRCTLRQMQGCLARKQVQRSDDDPTLFEVTYRGKHTCSQASSSSSNPNPNPNPNFADIKLEPYETLTHNNQKSQEIIWSFQTDHQKGDNKKPIKRNDNINLKSTQFSFPSSSNPNSTTILGYNNDFTSHGNLSPNTYLSSSSPMISSFNSRVLSEGEIILPGDNNYLTATTPEFSFGQGEFDNDFMFEDPHFLP